MALEVTGFDIQVSTKSFDSGMLRVSKNLRALGRQADAINRKINRVFRLREGQIVGNKAMLRLAALNTSVQTVTASFVEMAAAGKTADASLAASGVASAMTRSGAAAKTAAGSYSASQIAAIKSAAAEKALAKALAQSTAAQTTAAASAAKLAAARASSYGAGAAGYAGGIGTFMARVPRDVAASMAAANSSILTYSAGVAAATASQSRFQKMLTGTAERIRGVGTAAVAAGKKVVSSTNAMKAGFAGTHAGVMKFRYLLASLGGFLVLREVIGTLKEYEFRMSGVQAITRGTAIEMEAMDRRARILGATTMRFAQEAAHGMRQLAQAGFTATEAIAAIEGALDLSIAGTVDMGVATEIMANAIRGFNMDATEAGRVADVLAVAATRSNTNIALLGESMRYVAPVAHAVGMEIETTAAAIGIMGNAGIKGSMAGATLRRVISSLVQPTGGAQKAIAKMGLSLADLNPTLASTTPGVTRFTEVLRKLRDNSMGAAEAFAIFGLRGGPGATALVMMLDRFEELERAAFELEGEAKRMATVMGDNLRGELLRLRSAVQENIIAWGDAGLTGTMTKHVKTMTTVFRMWAGMTSPMERGAESAYKVKEAIEALAWVMMVYFGVRAVNAMVIGVLKIGTALAGFTITLGGVRAAVHALTVAIAANPLGLLLVAITGMIAATYHWATKMSKAGEEVAHLQSESERLGKTLKEIKDLSPVKLVAWEPKVVQDAQDALAGILRAQEGILVQQEKIKGQGGVFGNIARSQIKQPWAGPFWHIPATLISRAEDRRRLEELNEELVDMRDKYIEFTKHQNTINQQKERERQIELDIKSIMESKRRLMEQMVVTANIENEMELRAARGAEMKARISARHTKERLLAELDARVAMEQAVLDDPKRGFEAKEVARENIEDLTKIHRPIIESGYQSELVEITKGTDWYNDLLNEQKTLLESLQTPYDVLAQKLATIEELQTTAEVSGKPFLTAEEGEELARRATEEMYKQEEALHAAAMGWETLGSAVSAYESSLTALQTPTQWYDEQLALLQQRHERLWTDLAHTGEAQEELARLTAALTEKYAELEEQYQYTEYGIEKLKTVQDRWKEAVEALETPHQRYIRELEEIRLAFERLSGATEDQMELEALRRQRAQLEEEADLNRIRGNNAEERRAQEEKMLRATEGMPGYARDYIESTGIVDMGDAIEKMASQQVPALEDAFTSMFTDIIKGTFDAKKALDALALTIAEAGTRVIIQYLMSRAMQSLFDPKSPGPGGAGLAVAGVANENKIDPGGSNVTATGGQPGWMGVVSQVLGIFGLALGAAGALGGGQAPPPTPTPTPPPATPPPTYTPPPGQLPTVVQTHQGGIAGSRGLPRVAVNPAVFAGAPRYGTGGLIGFGRKMPKMGLGMNDIPAILHRGELVSPLKGGALPVTMRGDGTGFTQTPGGTTVPLDITGDNDGGHGSPIIFQQGAITVVAQKGERLDETAAQAARRAFAEGARQNRRNRR